MNAETARERASVKTAKKSALRFTWGPSKGPERNRGTKSEVAKETEDRKK